MEEDAKDEKGGSESFESDIEIGNPKEVLDVLLGNES